MSKSAIYLVNNSLAEVTDGNIIPLGTIIRRYGQNIRQDGNAVTVCDRCTGYYKVDIVATIEPATGGVPVKVVLEKDGVEVIGAVSEITPAPAGVVLPFTISVIVKNACGGNSALSVRLVGDNAKIVNMTTVVEKL